MTQFNFDLPTLFQQTFGYRSRAFEPDFDPADRETSQTAQSALLGSSYYSTDMLSREYYMPVTVVYNSGTGSASEWKLPHPVVAISSRKTIIETPLTERRGTVKELINVQDYDIVIKGFIINASNEFPEQDVTTLRNIYEINEPISIKCPVTDIFLLRPDRKGSDKVVIKELKFLPVAGVKNIRPYELHMVSDEPFNLNQVS